MNIIQISRVLKECETEIQQNTFSNSIGFIRAQLLSREVLGCLPHCFQLEEATYKEYTTKILSINECIITKVAKAQKFNLLRIHDEYQVSQKATQKSSCEPEDLAMFNLFLEPLINKICEEIENYNNTSQGVVYRLTNPNGINHYLVGTIHISNQEMTKAPLVQYAMSNSQKLIIETNNSFFWMYYKLRELKTADPYRFSIDNALRNLAKNQGKPIEGLEKISDFKYLFKYIKWEKISNSQFLSKSWVKKIFSSLKTQINSHLDETVKVSLKKGFVSGLTYFYSVPALFLVNKEINLIKSMAGYWKGKTVKTQQEINQRVLLAVIENSWQQGQTEIFDQNIPKELNEDRNWKWLHGSQDQEGLLVSLKNASTPICIGVGAAHLFGRQGLLNHFMENGFQIEKGEYSEGEITWN